jgi:hypothetical protein
MVGTGITWKPGVEVYTESRFPAPQASLRGREIEKKMEMKTRIRSISSTSLSASTGSDGTAVDDIIPTDCALRQNMDGNDDTEGTHSIEHLVGHRNQRESLIDCSYGVPNSAPAIVKPKLIHVFTQPSIVSLVLSGS